MDGYNPKSCNSLEKPFYRPVEAALRWCGLVAHEAQILINVGEDGIPKPDSFLNGLACKRIPKKSLMQSCTAISRMAVTERR